VVARAWKKTVVDVSVKRQRPASAGIGLAMYIERCGGGPGDTVA